MAASRSAKTKAVPQKPASDEAAKRDKRPPPHAHKRTPERERVVVAMSKVPNVTHLAIAEALGIAPKTLYAHYSDLIDHPGRRTNEHVPTPALRQLVANYKAVGLTNEDIAEMVELDRGTLEKHYARELSRGSAIVTGKVGNRVILRALGNGMEAQRASEFYLNGWKNRVTLEAEQRGRQEEEARDAATLVDGRKVTMDDARRVAFMLQKAALKKAQEVQVVSDEPAPESGGHGV